MLVLQNTGQVCIYIEEGIQFSLTVHLDIDKRNCMLVSRLGCLGKIRHGSKRWSGPLSRHLLAYQSIISNVHGSLRDLIEMILAAMFLEGLVDRDRSDWTDISLGCVYLREASDAANRSIACRSCKSIPAHSVW